MTQTEIREQIKEQIAALQRATAKAIKSKKAANKYLVDAGIIEQKKKARRTSKKKE
jgi:hypothetical protein